MDFVFDRTAEGRVTKALTIVEDATQEAAAIIESFNSRLRDECLNEPYYCTPAPRSKPGGGNTTKNDPGRSWAA